MAQKRQSRKLLGQYVLLGKPDQFIKTFPKTISFMSACHRNKVVKAMIYVVNSIERMFDPAGRPDVGSMFFRHCTKFQDIFIELLNSEISLQCPPMSILFRELQ